MRKGNEPSMEAVDWLRVARHIESAAAAVRRTGTSALVKFDGEREDGRIYTIVIFGRGSDDLIFRAETEDLESAVADAFPIDSETHSARAEEIAGVLRIWEAWARRGLVLILDVLLEEHVVAYSTRASDARTRRYSRAEGRDLLDVMRGSVGRPEAWQNWV